MQVVVQRLALAQELGRENQVLRAELLAQRLGEAHRNRALDHHHRLRVDGHHVAHHSVDFWLCTEDLPRADNRVTLGPDGEIHLALDEKNNVEGLKRLRHKLDSMLGDLGMHSQHGLLDHSIYLHKGMPIGATAHQAGTVRFGTDPATSVLNVDCRAHELDNLYVVDTSVFPSIGAVNPGLTAMANSLRVGDHLLGRLA